MSSSLLLFRSEYDAVIFNLDGVITKTAKVHAASWKRLFDEYLAKHSEGRWEVFDVERDYLRLAGGKPRYDGYSPFSAPEALGSLTATHRTAPTQKRSAGWETEKTSSFTNC